MYEIDDSLLRVSIESVVFNDHSKSDISFVNLKQPRLSLHVWKKAIKCHAPPFLSTECMYGQCLSKMCCMWVFLDKIVIQLHRILISPTTNQFYIEHLPQCNESRVARIRAILEK